MIKIHNTFETVYPRSFIKHKIYYVLANENLDLPKISHKIISEIEKKKKATQLTSQVNKLRSESQTSGTERHQLDFMEKEKLQYNLE